jgi:peptidoglycan-associated lipoprotein
MKTLYRAFVVGLILVVAALVPACRTTKKKDGSTTTTTATDTATSTQQETRIQPQPSDFVQTETGASPRPEQLPSDVEQLNQLVQSRGYLRDAFFGYDESTLSSDAQSALTASADWLRRNPQYTILIEGHCDERGTEQYNLALGDRRATIARDYLITLGVDAARIRTVSYGEERPFAEGNSESAWSQNRRAHLVVVGSSR